MENKEKVLCNTCKVETNHLVISEDKLAEPLIYEGREIGEYGQVTEFLKCMGCDSYVLRRHEFNTDDWDEEISYKFIPPRDAKSKIQKPYQELDSKIKKIYNQTIDAFNQNLNHLCAAGLRALVEAICFSKNIHEGPVLQGDGTSKTRNTLEGKINGLMEAGLMAKGAAEVLHAHRIIGNEALHELKEPKKEDLEKCIEVIEHVLDAVYTIPARNKKLKEKYKKPFDK